MNSHKSPIQSELIDVPLSTGNSHIIQLYKDEQQMTQMVGNFGLDGLKADEAVIIIATAAHLENLKTYMQSQNKDLSKFVKRGQLLLMDAAQTLSLFLVNGLPDAEKFKNTLGKVALEKQKSFGKLRAFGEMVGILWDEGNHQGTIKLEEIWHDFIHEHQFNLLCGYSDSQFANADYRNHFDRICASHTHVVPSIVPSEVNSENYFQKLAQLQQRDHALDSEVSERKRIQSELEDFFENGTLGLHWVDAKGIIIRANKAELNLLGYSAEEYIGHSITEFHADTEVIQDMLRLLTMGKTLKNYPARMIAKDGSIKHVLVDSNVLWRDGKFIHTRCFTRDVTDQFKIQKDLSIANNSLRNSEVFKEVILESIHDCIKVLDTNANLQFMNKVGLKKLHIDNFATVQGTCWLDFCKNNDRENAKRSFDMAVNGTSAEFTGSIEDAFSGKLIWWHVVVSPIYESTGEILKVLAISRDITENKEAELEILRAKNIAEAANEAKSRFLANMSHEIRTPIGAMLGFLDLMKNPGNSPADIDNYITTIDRNGNQLLRLIDDILDLSKIEANRITLQNSRMSLKDLFNDISSIMMFQARDKGLDFKTTFIDDIPEFIDSDQARIKQLLTNLIGNAIKFTDAGQVEVQIEYRDNTLNFFFKDTGIGLTEEQASKIFQAFVQADGSVTRRFGGTGLGLAISKRIAETMKGQLSLISSVPGVGSTFLLSIPVVGASETKFNLLSDVATPVIGFTPSTKTRLSGMCVLFVEDSPDNQFLISRFLQAEGAHIDIASDGAEGVEKASSKFYDVVLMDMQMPVLDGIEATKQLRAQGYGRPIIALTAHAMEEERRKTFAAGCTDHLTKPVNRQKLISVLARYR